MFVNGEEINLYNFDYKNDEEYYDIKRKKYYKIFNDSINGARFFIIRDEKNLSWL